MKHPAAAAALLRVVNLTNRVWPPLLRTAVLPNPAARHRRSPSARRAQAL